MNEGFQGEYKKHHQAAVKQEFLTSKNDKDEGNFNKYLNSTDLGETQRNKLQDRFEMQNTLGNNQYYTGNGVTENLNSGQKFGAVETLNFERKEVDLDQLIAADAIRIEKLG